MKRKIVRKHNNSKSCIICGLDNPAGLKAAFYELEGEEMLCVFTMREIHQSYPDRTHGGMSAAVLDETMGRAVNIAEPDTWGVTVNMSLTYRKPVPMNVELHALGRITKNTHRIFEATGEILLPDGSVAVEGSARYVKAPITEMADGKFVEEEWFLAGEAPDEIEV